VDGFIYLFIDGRTDGWMDGWFVWMEGQTNIQALILIVLVG
jgi:hypothetical protein